MVRCHSPDRVAVLFLFPPFSSVHLRCAVQGLDQPLTRRWFHSQHVFTQHFAGHVEGSNQALLCTCVCCRHVFEPPFSTVQNQWLCKGLTRLCQLLSVRYLDVPSCLYPFSRLSPCKAYHIRSVIVVYESPNSVSLLTSYLRYSEVSSPGRSVRFHVFALSGQRRCPTIYYTH